MQLRLFTVRNGRYYSAGPFALTPGARALRGDRSLSVTEIQTYMNTRAGP